jgi:hypothetical protein
LLPGFAGGRRRLAYGVCGWVGVGVATRRGEAGAVYTNALIVSRDMVYLHGETNDCNNCIRKWSSFMDNNRTEFSAMVLEIDPALLILELQSHQISF